MLTLKNAHNPPILTYHVSTESPRPTCRCSMDFIVYFMYFNVLWSEIGSILDDNFSVISFLGKTMATMVVVDCCTLWFLAFVIPAINQYRLLSSLSLSFTPIRISNIFYLMGKRWGDSTIHTQSLSAHLTHQYPLGHPSTLNIRRHIHPGSISVGTFIQTQSLSAHPFTLDIRPHIHPQSIAVGTSVQLHSFSVDISIHPQYRSAHISIYCISIGKSIYIQS